MRPRPSGRDTIIGCRVYKNAVIALNHCDGLDRLIREDHATQRTVSFDYGAGAGTPGEALNRVSQVIDSLIGTVASFEYAGSGRRVKTSLGNGVGQDVAGGSGYSRLDRFGRITDLMFRSSTGVKQRFEYGYDKAGNRIYTNATQLTADGAALFDDRSWLYGYDDLNRLISARSASSTRAT